MTDMTRYQACPECEGRGRTVHPALSVWTESDRDEDPDGFETMLDGGYDITCRTCRGLRVVPDTDEWREEQEYDRQDRLTRWYENGCPR